MKASNIVFSVSSFPLVYRRTHLAPSPPDQPSWRAHATARLLALALSGGLLPLRARTLEEQHVRFWLVNHVVHPPLRLLHAELAPLHLAHETAGGDEAGKILRENHVTVLKHIIVVLVTVQNLALQLLNNDEGLPLSVRVQGKEILRGLRWHNGLQAKGEGGAKHKSERCDSVCVCMCTGREEVRLSQRTQPVYPGAYKRKRGREAKLCCGWCEPQSNTQRDTGSACVGEREGGHTGECMDGNGGAATRVKTKDERKTKAIKYRN